MGTGKTKDIYINPSIPFGFKKLFGTEMKRMDIATAVIAEVTGLSVQDIDCLKKIRSTFSFSLSLPILVFLTRNIYERRHIG